jgi:hypothetical protein
MKTLEKRGAPMRNEEYLTAGKASALLHVSSKTLSRWRLENRLGTVRVVRTLGGPAGRGHFRYHVEDVRALAAELAGPVKEAS